MIGKFLRNYRDRHDIDNVMYRVPICLLKKKHGAVLYAHCAVLYAHCAYDIKRDPLLTRFSRGPSVGARISLLPSPLIELSVDSPSIGTCVEKITQQIISWKDGAPGSINPQESFIVSC